MHWLVTLDDNDNYDDNNNNNKVTPYDYTHNSNKNPISRTLFIIRLLEDKRHWLTRIQWLRIIRRICRRQKVRQNGHRWIGRSLRIEIRLHTGHGKLRRTQLCDENGQRRIDTRLRGRAESSAAEPSAVDSGVEQRTVNCGIHILNRVTVAQNEELAPQATLEAQTILNTIHKFRFNFIVRDVFRLSNHISLVISHVHPRKNLFVGSCHRAGGEHFQKDWVGSEAGCASLQVSVENVRLGGQRPFGY